MLGVALITNKAIFDYDSEDGPSHDEVISIANKRAAIVESLITEFVHKISKQMF